jgi:hypothetical protein
MEEMSSLPESRWRETETPFRSKPSCCFPFGVEPEARHSRPRQDLFSLFRRGLSFVVADGIISENAMIGGEGPLEIFDVGGGEQPLAAAENVQAVEGARPQLEQAVYLQLLLLSRLTEHFVLFPEGHEDRLQFFRHVPSQPFELSRALFDKAVHEPAHVSGSVLPVPG